MPTTIFFRLLSPPPVRRALAIETAIALVCTQVPLLNYLGYEFSALTALLGSVLSGMVTMALVSSAMRPFPLDRVARTGAALGALGEAVTANLALLLLPLAIMTVNGLAVRNCSMAEGLAFFLLLPVISVLFGSALGFFCVQHSRYPRSVFVVLCLAFLAYSAWTGYATPAIFSYNFLYGFFPGLTYDEVLPLSTALLLFRLLTLLAASVLAWMGTILLEECHPDDSTTSRTGKLFTGLVAPGRRLRTAGVILTVALVWFFRCELGFESTAEYIQRSLGGRYTTEHFTIYYSPSSFTGEEIRRVGAEHEFRLNQVLAVFALTRSISCESYIYPSPEVKLRLIGAGNTDIAKPWSGQIHMTKQSLDGSLKHELVHAAAAPFGLPVIRASLSTGIVEGLAVAVDGQWGNRTLHEYAAAIREFDAARDIRTMMSLWGFASQQSAVSYVLAGSFCKYLIDRHGIRKMLQLYRSADYQAIYGRSLDQLVGEWQGYLERVPLDDVDQDGVDALFRRPTIFAKVCARVLARRTMQARAAFVRKDYAEAESLYASCYDAGRGYDALAGLLGSALRRGKYGLLRAALDSIVLAADHPARYLPLFIGIGDAFWATGDTEKAFMLYDRVYHADLSEGLTEAAALRIIALNDDDTGGRYLPVLLSDAGDTARVMMIDSLLSSDPGNRVLTYLKGRTLMRLGDQAGAADALRSGGAFRDDDDLEALRLRFLGQAFFRLGRYNDAREAFWVSLNAVATDVAQERVSSWIDRCEWMQVHGY